MGATSVAVIAAIASYSHMRTVAHQYGQSDLISALMPLSVDGLVLAASVAIGDGRRRTWSAWLAFWIGVGASVAANVLAAQPSLIARLISAWPAIALLLVVEVLARSGQGDPVAGVDVSPADQVVQSPADTPSDPVDTPRVALTDLSASVVAFSQVNPDSEHRSEVVDTPAQESTQIRSGNAELVLRAVAERPGASIAELAQHTGLSASTIRRYRPVSRVNGHQLIEVAQ
jgi:hypothetical protein